MRIRTAVAAPRYAPRVHPVAAAALALILAFGATLLSTGFAIADPTPPTLDTPLDDAPLSSPPTDFGGGSVDAGAMVTVWVTNSDSEVPEQYCMSPGVVRYFGEWSCHVDDPSLPYGDNTFTATAAFPEGGVSANSNSVTIHYFNSSYEVADLVSPSDGSLTSETSPTFSGTGPAYAPVSVYIPGDVSTGICGTTVAADGTWSCVGANALPDGVTTVEVAIDVVEGTSYDSSTFLIEQPPAAPVITSPSDETTVYFSALDIQGTVTASDNRSQRVEVWDSYVEGDESDFACSATVDPGETDWTCPGTMSAGVNHLYAHSTYTGPFPGSGAEFGDNAGDNSAQVAVSFLSLPKPDMTYNTGPGYQFITADGIPGSDVLVEIYSVSIEDEVYGYSAVLTCPELGDGGGDPYSGNGDSVACPGLDLDPGIWNIYSSQHFDGVNEGVTSDFQNDFIRIPDAPTVATRFNDNFTVTIFGTGTPGDEVYVMGAGETGPAICGAVPVDEAGTWRCTIPATAGTHSYHAAQLSVGFVANPGCGCADTSVDGASRWSDESAPLQVPAPPAGTTPTPDSSPQPVTPPTPNWNFELTGLNLAQVHPGDHFTIHGSGLPAGSTVTFELHSTPIALGSATVAPDGTFSLSGTIPTTIEPGEHHIVATLTGPGLTPTTADKAITVTEDSIPATSTDSTSGATSDSGSSEHSVDALHDPGTAPNILSDSLNPIAEVFTDPGRVPAAFAAGLVLLLFAIMPAHLLNATLGEQYERFARRVPQLRNRPRWFAGLKAALDKAPVLGGVIITAITGFLFAFADPTFGFNLQSLRLVLALGAALFTVTYLANAITALIMRRAWDVDVVVSIRPLGLVLTVVGVILSRIMDFSPGFLIGLVLGLSIASRSAAKQAWKAVLIRTSVIAVFGIVAWIIYSSLAPGVHHDPNFTNELVLELFVAIATEGVVMMLIELLPFHLLEGERLYKRSRVLWGASYLLLLVVFVLAVVPWEGNWRELGESFWPWFTAVAIFGVVCVSIYLYFRYLAPHDDEGGDHDASLEDDQERIAVGDN